LELPLMVSINQEKQLLSRFESARQIYNASLGEGLKRLRLLQQSNPYQEARQLPKKDPKRKEAFKSAKGQYQFSDYSIQHFAIGIKNNLPQLKLDSHTTQKLATRSFRALEKVLYRRAKRVRFKGRTQIDSVESKNNLAGIRWKNQRVEWGNLNLEPLIDGSDPVIQHGLAHPVKYCRLVRRKIRSQNYFHVQLVLEGKPYIKPGNCLGKGLVGLDVGPSTIAMVNHSNASLQQFCSELDPKHKRIRTLQRRMDRQRRMANPNNYLPNGKIRKGRLQWKKSQRQKAAANNLREVQQRVASHRKSLHGNMANQILRTGDTFKTEKLSYKGFQKNYGKSVHTRAPGMLISRLRHKAESAGGTFLEFPTHTTRLSQSCQCGRIAKKPLNQRVHGCGCGIYAQRDLYSAFLAKFVECKEDEYILQTDQAQRAWSSAEPLLQAAWRKSNQSVNGRTCPSSFGRFQEIFPSQNRSPATERIVKFEALDAVPVAEIRESQGENAMVPFRTPWI
jgi:putative transposase